MRVLLSCEHASNFIPPNLAQFYPSKSPILKTHQALDIGALEMARKFQTKTRYPLVVAKVSRLVVDLNRLKTQRSLHGEKLWKHLNREQRLELVRKYYDTHYAKLRKHIGSRKSPVVHLILHTFTPRMKGETRSADCALLYDPAVRREKAFCQKWHEEFRAFESPFRIRKNYPYSGINSGCVKQFREEIGSSRYLGIELEVNQKYFERPALKREKEALIARLIESFQAALKS